MACYAGMGVVASGLEAGVLSVSWREVVVFSVGGLPFSMSLFERGRSFFKTVMGFLLFGVCVAVLFCFSSGLESGLLSESRAGADGYPSIYGVRLL